MEDLISVIINAYNVEKYIGKCLESIINQTYKNLEIIIINDGSTDNTLSICERYKDERIKIINQENMGLSKSRNIGIDNSNGKYLYFIDPDDFVENDVIEYLYSLIKKYNVSISTCLPLDIYDYNFKVKKKKEKVSLISSKDMIIKILLLLERAGTIWNKLIKKELFDNIRFEDRIINDVVVTYKIVLAVDKIAYSNQVKYYYLRHKDSILGKKKAEHSIDLYKASLERYDYIKNIFPKLKENEICVNSIIMYLYLQENSKVQDFLKEQDAFKLFKKMFSFKILICKMKFRDKIKIILFRINPKLCKLCVNNYLKLKAIIKK